MVEDCTRDLLQEVNPDNFNIHGLWPNSYTEKLDNPCTSESYNPNDLTSQTEAGLLEYWNGLYSSSDEFHTHEWSVHGSCWNAMAGE